MRQPSLSSEEWSRHIEEWKNSGLTQQAYCDQADISYASFTKRRSEFKNSETTFSSASFVEATPLKQGSVAINSLVLQVVLPNGARIGIGSHASEALFEQALLLAGKSQ